MSDHLNNTFKVHVDNKTGVVCEHDVDCDFVENILLVWGVSSVDQIKELGFVRPVKLVIDGIGSCSHQNVDGVTVHLQHAAEVKIDKVADRRVLLTISTSLKMSEDVLMPVDELSNSKLVFHGVLEDLLNDIIELIPVHCLFVVELLEVDIAHFVDLFAGLRSRAHHIVISFSLSVFVFLLFVNSDLGQ